MLRENPCGLSEPKLMANTLSLAKTHQVLHLVIVGCATEESYTGLVFLQYILWKNNQFGAAAKLW